MEIIGFEVSNWLVYLVVFLVSFYLYASWPYGVFKKLGIPGPKPIPFFGNIITVMREGFFQTDLNVVQKYGKVVGIYEGRHPTVLISDREAVKQIFMKDFHDFPNRRVIKMNGYPLDRGILVLEDDAWRKMRSTLSPVFSSGRIRKMYPLMDKCADTLANVLLEKAKKGEEFETKAVVGCFTMDSIAITMFGVEVDSQHNPKDPFVTNALDVFKATLMNPILIVAFFFPILLEPLAYFRIGFTPRRIANFFVNVTKAVIRQREEDPSTHRDDFIGHLLEEKANLTVEDIFAQSLTFFFAGYETTATALSFFFYFMALHPEWQERVRKEVNSLENLEYESLAKLRVMEQCLNETMRLYPPGVRFDRVAKKDCEVNGFRIPRGMCVSVPVYAIHRDPERWSDPDEFRPERFETEPEVGDFLPFGAGPRACIGMRFALVEAKLAIAKTLKKVRIVRCPRTETNLQFLKSGFIIPLSGLWVKAEPLDA